jgi:tetratricopeptide (TPR) repeat protein
MNHGIRLAFATAGFLLLVACGSSKEVKRAREFIDARMFDQAIVLLNQEIQQNPKNAEAHMLLGECYLGKGVFGQAEQEFNTATLLDKDLTSQVSKDCYALGKDLAKGNKTNAHRALMMAVKYDSSLEKDEQFYFLTYVDTEDDQGTRMDTAKKYLTLFPTGSNAAQAAYQLAEGLDSYGDRKQAKIYFNQVASQFPGTEWGKKASDRLAHWVEPVIVRVYNIDDLATVYVNGSLVLTVPFKSNNQLDITSQLHSGKNEVRLVVQNSQEGYAYGFEILQNNEPIFKQECGQVDVVGCAGNEFRTGTVYDRTVYVTVN